MANEHPVAPNNKNHLVGFPIRFCWMKLALGGAHEELERAHMNGERSATSQARVFLDRLSIEVLKKGYVLLVPLTGPGGGPDRSQTSQIVCRTNDAGELVEITEGEIDGECPSDPAKVLWMPPGQTFAYFWTHATNKNLFKVIVQNTKADVGIALKEYGFDQFTVRHHDRRELQALPAFDVSDDLKGRLHLLVHGCAATLGQRGGPGYFTGAALNNKYMIGGAGQLDAMGHYVLAQSEPIAALYLAALVAHHAIDLRILAQRTYGVFHVAESLRASALRGDGHYEDFDKENKVNKHGEVYRHYAFECAKAGVDRKDFIKAIRVTGTHLDWMEPAQRIQTQYNVPHPCLPKGWEIHKRWEYKGLYNDVPIRNYFDFYRFGKDLEGAPWQPAVATAEEKNNAYVDRAFGHARALLKRFAPYETFMRDIGAHQGAADAKLGVELHTLYLDVALRLKHPWWKDFKIEDPPVYEKLELFLGWLATFTDKGGELFKIHFGDADKVIEYNHLLRESADEFEQMFLKLDRWNEKLGDRIAQKMSAQIDWAAGTITVNRAGEINKIGPFYFLQRVEDAPVTRDVKTKSRSGKTRWRPKKVPGKKATVEVLDLPFKKVAHWPAFLGAFGDFVALTMCLYTLSRDLEQKGGIEVFGKLAQNVAQQIDSASGALSTLMVMLQKAPKFGAAETKLTKFVTWFARTGEHFAPWGAGIEAVFNVRDGVLLLFDVDLLGGDGKSDAQSALEEGNTGEASVLRFKGLVLLSGTSIGIVTTIVAGALTPLSIALGVTALVVLTIDAGLYIYHGPADAMEDTRKALDKAIETEFGKNMEKVQPKDGEATTPRNLRLFDEQLAVIVGRIN